MPILLLMVATSVVADSEFETFKQQQQQVNSDYNAATEQAFLQYKKQLDDGFTDYQQTYLEESKKYRKQIIAQWGNYKEGDKSTWVNYAKNDRERESVNYASGVVEIEFLAYKNESLKQIKQRAQQSVATLLTTTEKQAFENDVLAQKVEDKIKQYSHVVITGKPSADNKMLARLIDNLGQADKDEIKQLANKFVASASTSTTVIEAKELDKQKVVKLTFKIPEKLSEKAARYQQRVREVALKEDVPVSLVYAVMETESNFNPLAKSHIPAYGLMQIVPMSAGKDASKYLFGKEKILSPSYLYNSDNNIAIGGAYLHILYHQYLKKVNDKTNRLFCTIAAYNTGTGNVAKSFVGSYNVNKAIIKINQMSATEVYRHLRKKLPHDETKDYIQRVATRLAKYQS